jgi:hypothetical protein
LLGDALHIPVGTSITTRNIFFSGGNAALTTNMGTADFLYPVLAQPAPSLNFDYTSAYNLGFNVDMKGPILAATFRF